ncbi:hypothetical protein [Yersinia phage PY100]|nr:hypothetical protein [Yersinia phage PY100]
MRTKVKIEGKSGHYKVCVKRFFFFWCCVQQDDGWTGTYDRVFPTFESAMKYAIDNFAGK